MLRGFVDDAIYGNRSKLSSCEPIVKSSKLELESQPSTNDLAEFVFYSDRKPSYYAGTKLRREIYEKLQETDLLLQIHVSDIVNKFVKDLPLLEKKETNEQHELFTCKCGWLLYEPTTLPCGHTFCKKCVQENKFCLECGDTLTPSSCNVCPLLVDVLSSWLGTLYVSTGHKNKAKRFFSNYQFTEALSSINEALLLVAEDFTALNIRVETRYSLEDYQEALDDAELSCKINSQCSNSHFIRALCHLALKNFDQAIDAFQQCMELDPGDVIMINRVITNLSNVFALDVSIDVSDTKKNLSKLQHLYRILDDDVFCSDNSKDINFDLNLSTDTILQVKSRENSENIPGSSCIETSKNESSIKGVPANLIDEEIFECKLCYDLLFQPVTMICGHVFCKSCIVRTLDYNALCPICRLELTDYMKNPNKPMTVIIEDILQVYLKDQFNKRSEEHVIKMKQLAKVGIDDSVEHPIFVCSIAFPNVECPLHIFEPKYRQLIRDCLESGGCRFGMCSPQQKDDEYSDLGTILTVTSYEILDDGRFIIRTIAGKRFECKEKYLKGSINYATVAYFEDDEIDSNAEEFSSTTQSAYDDLASYISSLQDSDRDVLFNALGKLQPYEGDTKAYPDGLPWVWWGLAALPLNFTAKLALLRSKGVTQRLGSLRRFLKFLCR